MYKYSQRVVPGTNSNKSSCLSEQDLNSGSPDFKSGILTVGPHHLPPDIIEKIESNRWWRYCKRVQIFQ